MSNDSIHELPRPHRLIVPLVQVQHALDPAAQVFKNGGKTPESTLAIAQLLVGIGQQVEAGTPIARADEPGSPTIHAPLAGRIVATTRVATAWTTGIPAVEMEMAGAGHHSKETAGTDARKGDAQAARGPQGRAAGPLDLWSAKKIGPFQSSGLADLADQYGVMHMPRSSGLGAALREAAPLGISHLIINGLQPEPRCTTPPRILGEHLEAIAAAGLTVRDALDARRLWLVVDAADRKLVRDCRNAVLGTPIRVLALPNKYPQAAETLLAWTVGGVETPPGAHAIDAGVFILQPESLADLWAALYEQAPATHRVVAISGPAALAPGHYRIPVGTSYADILRHVGLRQPLARLVDGGPLTGRCVESLDAVITPATSTLLLIDREHDLIARPGPCIHCGACQEDCPAGLNPQKLLEVFEIGPFKRAASLIPAACIECGLCTYVCPAELPLAQAAIHLKHAAQMQRDQST